MARSAVVKSASLSADEAELADQLAARLAGGSFTELTRLLLHRFGAPLGAWLHELEEAGLDPNERLGPVGDGPTSTERELREFYQPASTWPEEGPKTPPSY